MSKDLTTWEKTRKFLNDVHLWLGLGSGIIVFLVCLSGTIYTFNTEIREASTPELFHVTATAEAKALPTAQLIAKVESTTGGKVLNVKVPADANRSWQLGVKKAEKEKGAEDGAKAGRNAEAIPRGERAEKGQNREGRDKGERPASSDKGGKGERGGKGEKAGGKEGAAAKGGGRPTIYYVNQYTGEILGNSGEIKNGTVTFMTSMFSLHRWLLLDKVENPIFEGLENRKLGSYISGTATILFTIGVITGIVIWFPRKIRAWKQGLTIKTSGSWKRTNHDLHNTLGFYACFFLLLMGVTGPQWSFEWYRTGLRKTLGTYKEEGGPGAAGGEKGGENRGERAGNGKSGAKGEDRGAEGQLAALPAANLQRASFEDYQQAVAKTFAFKGDYVITLPADSAAPVSVNKFKAGFFAPAAADKLTLDQYSTAVIKVERFADMPFNERTSASIKALHIGDVYGMFTKIIYFLACLIATSLPITGTMIWLNKMKKTKPRSKKPLPQVTETVQV